MAFATIADIESRWRTLSTDERTKASVLLEDAEVLIRSEFANKHKTIDLETQAVVLKIVSVAIVKRAMNSPDIDANQYSTTVGSFSEQYTFSTLASDGALFIKKGERAMLGLLNTGKLANTSLTGTD